MIFFRKIERILLFFSLLFCSCCCYYTIEPKSFYSLLQVFNPYAKEEDPYLFAITRRCNTGHVHCSICKSINICIWIICKNYSFPAAYCHRSLNVPTDLTIFFPYIYYTKNHSKQKYQLTSQTVQLIANQCKPRQTIAYLDLYNSNLYTGRSPVPSLLINENKSFSKIYTDLPFKTSNQQVNIWCYFNFLTHHRCFLSVALTSSQIG